MDNTNAQIQQLYNLYYGINENVNALFSLYRQLKDNMEENLTTIYNILNQLLSTQEIILTSISSIQSQIQILTINYQQLENSVLYLEEQISIINDRMSIMENTFENFEIEMRDNINAIIDEMVTINAYIDNLRTTINSLQSNINSIQNEINLIELRLNMLEQLLEVPSGFPTYLVRVNVVDEDFNRIENVYVYLIMANGRMLSSLSPAVFENVLADKTVIRCDNVRYEFVLDSPTYLTLMRYNYVVTMIYGNINFEYPVSIFVDGENKGVFENTYYIFTSVGEHTIEARYNNYYFEKKVELTHKSQRIDVSMSKPLSISERISDTLKSPEFVISASMLGILVLIGLAFSKLALAGG
jgi:hypothetical protein